jgi:hypothetical protein
MITIAILVFSVILMAVWGWIWGRISYGKGYAEGRTDQLESLIKAGLLK